MNKKSALTQSDWKKLFSDFKKVSSTIDQVEWSILNALNSGSEFEFNVPYDIEQKGKGFKSGKIQLIRNTRESKIFVSSFHVDRGDGSNKLANVTIYKFERKREGESNELTWNFVNKISVDNSSKYGYPLNKLHNYIRRQLSLDGHKLDSHYAKVLEAKSESDLVKQSDVIEKVQNLTDVEKLDEILNALIENKTIVKESSFFEDKIQELLKNSKVVTSEDVVAVGYRKNQLEVFNKLLNEDDYLEKYKNKHNIKKPGQESAWQFFFEKNPWIWGYGLNYVWSGPFDENPIEKVVSGHTFFQSGKKADGVLSTISQIKSFVIVEIKLPEHELLEPASDPYRKECWKISGEVTGGIAQCQKTKHKFVSEVKNKVDLIDDNGDPTGETIYAVRPKSFLIVGNLRQFKTEYGINDEKFSSFELFRNSNVDPEIITYDELFERAKYIVNSQSTEDVK